METKNIIPKNQQEVAISTARLSTADQWEKFRLEKSKNGTFMQFDSYRTSLGHRDLWGTKVFFKSMIDIDFLQFCPKITISSGKYCPSQTAHEKYPQFFTWDEDNHIWGLSEQSLDEFDELILPMLTRTAVKIKAQFKEANKRKQKARYLEKKAVVYGNQKIIGESI